jgi:hypothetical protein
MQVIYRIEPAFIYRAERALDLTKESLRMLFGIPLLYDKQLRMQFCRIGLFYFLHNTDKVAPDNAAHPLAINDLRRRNYLPLFIRRG